MASEILIVSDDRIYDYKKGTEKFRNIGKKKAEQIFRGWISAGKKINRKYGMGGHVCWVWPE